MAIAHVQGTLAIGNGVSSLSLSFGSPPTAGNLVVACFNGWVSGGPPTISSVADNRANSYSLAVAQASSEHKGWIYHAANVATGNPFTVTVTFNEATVYAVLAINEYSGAATSSVLDGTSSGTGTGTAASSGSVTPTGNAAYVGSMGHTSLSTPTLTGSAGWSERQEQENNADHTALSVIDKIASGAQTAGWTIGSSVGWYALVAAYREPSGGRIIRRRCAAGPAREPVPEYLW